MNVQNLITEAEQLNAAGQHIEATLYFDKALDKAPELFERLNSLRFESAWKGFKQAQDNCDWRHYDRLQRLLSTGLTQGMWVIGEMTLAAPVLSNLDLLTFTSRHGEHVMRNIPDHKPFTFTARKPADRIKIGFLGADFFNQATAYLLTEAVAHIDRDQFDVIAYDHGLTCEDPLRTRAHAAYDEMVPIHDLSDTAAAERIHGDGIEVLFSIKNTTTARLGILARRPAPLQVHYLYFPGTSGMPFFDAFVADEIVVPPALEYGYSEKIWRIDGCYQPNDDTRPLPRETNKIDWGLPADAIVLANMSQGYKITPNVFDLWMRILRNNPACILWLLADKNPAVNQRLSNEAAQRGVNPNRLYFSPTMSTPDHLTRLLCADLIIDTFPYGGHTLTSDALWAGTPVVTLAGETYASRVAASLLTHAGMPELVTYSHDAYVRGIQTLVEDAPRRTAYRAHLTRNRRNFELFSSSSYAQRFGAMVRRYARGA